MKATDNAVWCLGEARYATGRERRVPDNPDKFRGVWTVGGQWVCDCTDQITAGEIIAGHNSLLVAPEGADRNG